MRFLVVRQNAGGLLGMTALRLFHPELVPLCGKRGIST
jgi:hypothetical protein